HFPPGKSEYKDTPSIGHLAKVKEQLDTKGWQINNIDATVIAEKPRLREYIDRMRELLSQTLGIQISQVSVKASTANQVGALGNEEAIAAIAIASVQKVK
ncbi:MAG: 2-C-methyl-D-erythritol 2,4-cyclodiphosphate synthase, partial [Chloroflexi bacterium]|nr:2-C-methyl-D-erythritol 2,4-cyclodiphosphate synthase [Chloroflexota bacterium]